MTVARSREEAKIIADRRDNEPAWMKHASWDGHRSVRVHVGGRYIGLSTAAYSYLLTDDEKQETSRRMAALWTYAALKGWTTGAIECAIDGMIEKSKEAP